MASPAHQHGHGHDAHAFAGADVAAAMELEGDVLAGFVTQGADAIAAVRGDAPIRRVLDLGCGPGVGTAVLAARFPTAAVLAADGSAAMLERAAHRASALGVADRVDTRQVDLPADLGSLGPVDVVWASMVLHHLGDEAAALRQVRGLVEPDGLVALVERWGPTRVLPPGTDLGRPGLWERIDAAWDAWNAEVRPTLPGTTPDGAYRALLEGAGLEVVADEVLTVALDAPLDPLASRLARKHLERCRAQVAAHADPEDLAVLDRLLGAGGAVDERADVQLHATRHLLVGRAR